VNWLWAEFCALGAATLFVASLWALRAARRWRLQGWCSNGLGYNINAEKNRLLFELVVAWTRVWAGLAFVCALVASMVSIAWVWKALTF
jgi:hypothetical protein